MPKRRVVLLLCALALASCKDDDEKKGGAGEDVYEAKLFPTTHELSAATLAAMNVDDGSGQLVFTSSSAELTSIAPGHVILAGQTTSTPSGLLRFVTKVEPNGAGVRLTTVQAPLQAAFQKLHVKSRRRSVELTDDDVVVTPLAHFGPQKRIQAVRAADGVVDGKLDIDEVLYDGDNNASTTDDQVRVLGTIGGSYDYLLGFDTDWGIVDSLPSSISDCVLSGFSDCEIGSLLPEASAGFELHARADATVKLSGSPFLKYTKDIPIASATFGAFAIGPLVFFPELRITAKLEGKASSLFEVTAGAHAGVDGGASFSTSKGAYGQSPTPFFEFDPPSATVALSAEGRVGVESRLRLALYKVMGPYGSLTAYALVKADQNATPCWNVDVGLDGALGFDIGVDLGNYGYQSLADAKAPFSLINETVADGSCALPAGFSSLPIGAGPDPEHLANPTFVPYANQLTPTAVSASDNSVLPFEDGRGYAGDGTYHTYSARTIDGAFAIGGTGSTGIAKVRENGTPVWASRYQLVDGNTQNQYGKVRGIASNGDTTIVLAVDAYGLVYLDQGGNIVSARTYDVARNRSLGIHGNSDGADFFDIVAADNGGVFVIGTQTDTVDGFHRMWIHHLSVSGEIVWSQRFIADGNHSVFPTVAFSGPSGGLTVAGFLYRATEYHQAFVLQLSSSGSVELAKAYTVDCTNSSDPNDGQFLPIGGLRTAAGDIVLTGNAANFYTGASVKINSAGTSTSVIGRRQPGANGSLYLSSLDELPTGGFIAVGFANTRLMLQILDSGLTPTSSQYVDFKNFNMSVSQILATDDGGGLIHGLTAGDDGYLFAAKLPAKNLDVTYAPSAIDSLAAPTTESVSCTHATVDWNPGASAFPVAAHSTPARRDNFTLTPTQLNQ